VVSDELSADFEEVCFVQMARSGFCRLILSIKGFYENFFSRDGRMREGFFPRGRASTSSESSPLLPVDEVKMISKEMKV
jgi:hypothetical protein